MATNTFCDFLAPGQRWRLVSYYKTADKFNEGFEFTLGKPVANDYGKGWEMLDTDSLSKKCFDMVYEVWWDSPVNIMLLICSNVNH